MLGKGQVMGVKKGYVKARTERLRFVGAALKSSRVPQSVSQIFGVAA